MHKGLTANQRAAVADLDAKFSKRLNGIDPDAARTATDFGELLDAEERAADTPAVETCVDAADLLDEPDEPDNPLIEGLVDVGSYCAIVGPAKAMKSWLDLQTAVCVAAGVDFFGRKVTRKRVYLANVEVTKRTFTKRLRAIVERLGIEPADLRGWLFIDNLRGKKVTFEIVREKARAHAAEVVMIDPFYQVFEGKETDEADCQLANEEIKKFLALGMTVFVVFHAPKGYAADRQTVDMISGSSVLVRFPENVIAILPHASEKDARVIDCSVLRDYAAPDPWTVRFDGALVNAPDIVPELKSGKPWQSRKTPPEKEAEAVRRYNESRAKMTAAALEFLNAKGDEMPNAKQFSDHLKTMFDKPRVEDFIKSINGKAVEGIVSQDELTRDPKSGAVKKKASRNGGVKFFATPERANAYRAKFDRLPLT